MYSTAPVALRPEIRLYAYQTGPFEGGHRKIKHTYVAGVIQYDDIPVCSRLPRSTVGSDGASKYALEGEAEAERPRHREGSVVLGGGLVLLVPRQLARAGMTGNVPYYGGRFTPAQAYAASHPRQAAGGPLPPAPPAPPSPAKQAAQLEALQRLRDDGLISAAEHDRLASRVTG